MNGAVHVGKEDKQVKIMQPDNRNDHTCYNADWSITNLACLPIWVASY